jgi:hypothetical protein
MDDLTLEAIRARVVHEVSKRHQLDMRRDKDGFLILDIHEPTKRRFSPNERVLLREILTDTPNTSLTCLGWVCNLIVNDQVTDSLLGAWTFAEDD